MFYTCHVFLEPVVNLLVFLFSFLLTGGRGQLGLPLGSIKATVLIENVLAAFEMEEILYELRDHSAGLNCGIWDYSASFVNKFGKFCCP